MENTSQWEQSDWFKVWEEISKKDYHKSIPVEDCEDYIEDYD
jgi:hypothetical protein